MMLLLTDFFSDERGQDLVEYTLLLAFVVCASAALFLNNSSSISRIWDAADESLSEASTKTL